MSTALITIVNESLNSMAVGSNYSFKALREEDGNIDDAHTDEEVHYWGIYGYDSETNKQYHIADFNSEYFDEFYQTALMFIKSGLTE